MVSTVDCQLLAERYVNGCINIVVVNQRQLSLATSNRAQSLGNNCREASLYVSGLPARITCLILSSQSRCTNMQVDTAILSRQVKSRCWNCDASIGNCYVAFANIIVGRSNINLLIYVASHVLGHARTNPLGNLCLIHKDILFKIECYHCIVLDAVTHVACGELHNRIVRECPVHPVL